VVLDLRGRPGMLDGIPGGARVVEGEGATSTFTMSLFNLTRGTYTICGGSRMLEFGQYRGFHMRLANALRPGGLWHGHRVVLSGDYDDR
jgi:hypothetical protein